MPALFRSSNEFLLRSFVSHRLYKLKKMEAVKVHVAFQASFVDADCACFRSSAMCYQSKAVGYQCGSGSLVVQKPLVQSFLLHRL